MLQRKICSSFMLFSIDVVSLVSKPRLLQFSASCRSCSCFSNTDCMELLYQWHWFRSRSAKKVDQLIPSLYQSYIKYAIRMASRLRRLLLLNSDSICNDIVNSNETRTGPIFKVPSPNNYHNWTTPKVKVDTIYKIRAFNFVRAYLLSQLLYR